MRIERLIIQNLNSIEDAEIVFSEGVLAKEPLFLICGETGSGKSTILDAITLALFDKVSRYENVRNKEKVESGITTKDTYNILRKGKYDGKAELHFSVNDDCYVATWSVHKTKSNTYSKTNRRRLEIVKNGLRTVVCSNINDVNDKIVELIELTYEQFVRSVMLAQGEFNTFLVSERSRQSEILEMLTGTEVYSQIAERIRCRKNEASQRKKEAENLYNRLKNNVLSEEELASLESDKSKVESRNAECVESLRQIENSLNWIKRNNDLDEECNKAKSLYDNVVEQIDSPEYKKNKSIVEDYFSTAKVRERLNELQRFESEIVKINKQFENDAKLFSDLKFLLQKEKNNVAQLDALMSETKEWIDNRKDKESVFENVNLIVSRLEEMSQLMNQRNDKVIELKRAESEKTEVEKLAEELLISVENVKKIKLEVDKSLDDLLQKFNSEENDKLLEDYKKITENKQKAISRISKLNAVRTVLEQYLILNQDIEKDRVIYNNLKLLFNNKNNDLTLAKTNFEMNDLEFQKQKNMVEDWAKSYRNKLKDGEPCPVCGSREHFFKDETVVNSLFVSLENEWKRLKDIYEKTQKELNKIESDINVVCRNISSDESKSKNLLNKLNELCNGNPIFELERIDFNICKHNESIAAFDKEIEVVNLKLKEIALLKDKIDHVQNDKKTVEKQIYTLEQQCLLKQNKLREIELSLTALKTNIFDSENKYNEKKNSVNEYLKLENWEKSWNDDSLKFIREIKELAVEWSQKHELLKNIENQKVNLENLIKRSEVYFEHISEMIPEWKTIDATESYVETDKLIPYLSAIYEMNKERISQKTNLEKEKAVVASEVEDFINQNAAIDAERLKSLNQIIDIQEYDKKNKYFDEKLIEYKKALAIKEEELILHQNDENKPKEPFSYVELNERKTLLIEESKKNDELLSEIKSNLLVNKQTMSESEAYKEEYERVANECHLWEQLAKAIGTSDNDNFRDVAQAYTMGILLDRANYYMRQLSSRYVLANYPDSLAIMVQDMEMGGEMRTASSLSGGETFLVSLALALGLTSLNDNHFNTDMLFIDEGFGTLDSQSLDMVMNTLENLHSLGRRVGIISHVDTLKERIPAKIQLIREGKSASRVCVIRS